MAHRNAPVNGDPENTSTHTDNGKPRDVAGEWSALAEPLASWARNRIVNRDDAHGGYRTDSNGGVLPTTHKTSLTEAILRRHFAATQTADVRGAHAIGRDESGASWSLWCAVDIDQHGSAEGSAPNLRAALAWYGAALSLGFRPLLLDSNGRGGFHLIIAFRERVPSAVAYAFVRWLTRDFAAHGLESRPECFPKQIQVTDAHPFGNWLRVPGGRHHKRDHYARVWDGERWLESTDAARAILAIEGDNPALIPADAKPQPRQEKPRATANKGNALDDIATATEALRHLPNSFCDQYDEWLRVGMALSGLGSIGLQLWDQWSAGSPRYEPGACAAKWGSFTAAGNDGVGLGSLVRWAKDNGWKRAKSPAPNGNGHHTEQAATIPTPSANGNGNGYHPPLDDAPRSRPRRRPLTDLGNAERLTDLHGADLRYCHPWESWLVWTGSHWRIDDCAAVTRRMKHTARSIYKEAGSTDDDEQRKAVAKWAQSSESKSRIEAALWLARAEEGIPIHPDEMDRDPWALNVWNGTVDLRTGELRPHDRRDLLTKIAPVKFDKSARCPVWEETLDVVFNRNDRLIRFWQRLCGLALTGSTAEQILPILHGSGANGKSTLLNALMAMMGPDYAMKATHEMLMMRRNEVHLTETADLFGKRLVVAIESGEGARINESLIKELTGGDRIRARRMRENHWEFAPTHKIMLCTNHEPRVRGTDHAIWRRLKKIPFTVTIPDAQQDKALPAKLAAEAPGILAWCVVGALEWQASGLNPPAEVVEATERYRADEDALGGFLAEHVLTEPSLRSKASAIYARYRTWAEGSGESPLNLTRFGKAMAERGFKKETSNGTWYLGLGLRQSEPME